MNLFEIEPDKPSEDGGFLEWLDERCRAMAACAARQGGHRWQIEGEPGEEPCLSCEDCPAGGDDLYPDIHDHLAYDGQPQTISDHQVAWGQCLPDDAEPYTIPVDVEIEAIRYESPDFVGYEYDVRILLTPRGEAA